MWFLIFLVAVLTVSWAIDRVANRQPPTSAGVGCAGASGGTMTRLILLGALLLTPVSKAIEGDKAAHFGVSLGLSMAFYQVYRKAFKMPTVPAVVASSVTVLFIGLAKEGMDATTYGRFDHADMLANTAGVATASFLNWRLDL